MANTLKAYLLRYLRDLRPLPIDELLEKRYQKFRRMGVFDEGLAEMASQNGFVAGKDVPGMNPPAAAGS
jgi:hypothetical protein